MRVRYSLLTLLFSFLFLFPFYSQGESEYEIDLSRSSLPTTLQMTSENIAIYFDDELVPDPRLEVFIETVAGEEVVELEAQAKEVAGKQKLALKVQGAKWGDVNVRSGPSTEFDVVDIVHNGDVLKPIFQETNGWWHIELSEGKKGWISGYYVIKEAEGQLRETKSALKNPILFRPWRATTDRDVLDWALTISDQNGKTLKKLSKEGNAGREIPTTLSWDGVDEEGSLIELGHSYNFQFETQYPNGEKALSPMHTFAVVEPGHLRLIIPLSDFANPEFEHDGAVAKKLNRLVEVMKEHPDEQLVLEHFTVDGVRDSQALTTEEIVARLKAHPMLAPEGEMLALTARTYKRGEPDSVLEFASLNRRSFYQPGADAIYLSGVKVDELLYDPSRLKNYTVTVDLNGVVASTTAQEWYNVVYDPTKAVSKVRIVKLPREKEEAPVVIEEKPKTVEWRRLRAKELALGAGAYWTRTYATTKDSEFTDTTGIGKLNAEFDLAWWGFPFFGWLFGKDLGVEAQYRNNIFDRKTDVKGTGAPTSIVRPNITWFEGNLMYRFAFGEYYDSPQLFLKAGYHYYDFDVDTVPLVVVDHTYRGALITVGTLLPLRTILDDLSFSMDLAYGPAANYSETGRTGDRENAKWADIIHAEATLNYQPWDFVSFHLGSWLNSYYVKFDHGAVRENYVAFGGGNIRFHIY